MLNDIVKQALHQRSLVKRTLFPSAENMVITGADSEEQADAYAKMLAGKQSDEAVYTIKGKDLFQSVPFTTTPFLSNREAQIFVLHALYEADEKSLRKAIDEFFTMYERGTVTFVFSGDDAKIASMIDAYPGLASRMYPVMVKLDPQAEASPSPAVTAASPKADR